MTLEFEKEGEKSFKDEHATILASRCATCCQTSQWLRRKHTKCVTSSSDLMELFKKCGGDATRTLFNEQQQELLKRSLNLVQTICYYLFSIKPDIK